MGASICGRHNSHRGSAALDQMLANRLHRAKRYNVSLLNWFSPLSLVVFTLIARTGSVLAQTEAVVPSPSALKKMSVEELMDVE